MRILALSKAGLYEQRQARGSPPHDFHRLRLFYVRGQNTRIAITRGYKVQMLQDI